MESGFLIMKPSGSQLENYVVSSEDVRKILRRLLSHIAEQETLSIADAFNSGRGFSMGSSGTVQFTEEYTGCVKDLEQKLQKRFGNFIDRKWLNGVVQSFVHRARTAPGKENSDQRILADIFLESVVKTTLFVPCKGIVIKDYVDEISLGFASIVGRQAAADEINSRLAKNGETQAYLNKSSNLIKFSFSSDFIIEQYFPSLLWKVTVYSPKELRREYAEIQIQQAVTTLRLQGKPWSSGYLPGLSDVEANPIFERFDWSAQILLTGEDAVSMGGASVDIPYEISEELAKRLTSSALSKQRERLLNAKSGTIGSALSDAFYWSSIGRQTANRSRRLLAFATALETMLTKSDKHSPVVDTIARFTGALWTKSPSGRKDIAKLIRNMYSSRSETVHQGRQSASSILAKDLHIITETICLKIFEQCDLLKPISELHSVLTEATYGSELDLTTSKVGIAPSP